jgi:hypothetical protein
MFRTIYESPWHHPGLAFLLGGLGILLVVALRPFHTGSSRRAWALLFSLLQAEILLDAALTGALSPLSPGSLAGRFVPVLFVMLGDLRYFYLVERQRQADATSRHQALGAAILFSLIVPVSSGLERLLFPDFFVGNRLFLSYEATFLFLIAIHYFTRARGPYARRLFGFECAQYLLWATADVLILAGIDAGYALRIVPNVFYYVGFAPFAILAASDEARP